VKIFIGGRTGMKYQKAAGAFVQNDGGDQGLTGTRSLTRGLGEIWVVDPLMDG
jgi:hypothetical protein